MKAPTQNEKVIETLRAVRDGKLAPAGFTIVREGHTWLSNRYFKHVMLLSEVNGRTSENRADGYDIATLETERDPHGFAYHRLASEPKRKITVYDPVWRDGKIMRVPRVIEVGTE